MNDSVQSTDINSTTIGTLWDRQVRWRKTADGPATYTRNSFFQSLLAPRFGGRQRLFMIHDSDRNLVGNVVARVSPTICDKLERPIGMLGFFQSENEREPITRLLNEAVAWLHEQNARSIVGPIDGDTWHRYRINVGPWDQPPFLFEPENPQYYSRLWTIAGFEVVDRYHSKFISDVGEVIPRMKPAFDAATAGGYRFREMDFDQFDSELEKIYALSCRVFRNNFLYDEITLAEFVELYRHARSIAHPKLIWFALDTAGQEIGFVFCIVDYLAAVGAMNGKTDWWAKLKFLWHRPSARAVNFKSIGVVKDHRRSSVAAAMMYLGYANALKLGYRRANLCLIRDGNPSDRLDGGLSRILRRYELYQFPGSQFF